MGLSRRRATGRRYSIRGCDRPNIDLPATPSAVPRFGYVGCVGGSGQARSIAMNAFSPDAIRAETITIIGHGGDEIEAYSATPLAEGSRGGIVWIHHMPGYDRETKEFARRLAVNGYHVVAPNLYAREAPGAAPDDAAAAARAAGGVPDNRLVGDVAGAVEQLSGLP